MNLNINIDLDGEAFRLGEDTYQIEEIERILENVAERLYGMGTDHPVGILFRLRDVNGNTCGSVELEES